MVSTASAEARPRPGPTGEDTRTEDTRTEDTRTEDTRTEDSRTNTLRARYDEAIEEIRVILPGVQVLFAFLITAPFSSRFADLDTAQRLGYAVALVASTTALVLLMTPVAYHRLSKGVNRTDRIAVTVKLKLTGLAALGISIAAALFSVTSFVFSTTAGVAAALAFTVGGIALWVVLPVTRRK